MQLCYVHIKIKSNSLNLLYEVAFNLIRYLLGYSKYKNVDSWLSGKRSYPPKGAVYPNKGIYDFQLPPGEVEECTNHVHK